MRTRLRLVVCGLFLVAAATACNAILGITDLVDPHAGGDADIETATPVDAFVPPPTDSGSDSDALAPCNAAGDPDPCMVVEPQAGGAIFPTWAITSDETIVEGASIIQPNPPAYDASAGAGVVVEEHTKLAWQTFYRDGGADNLFELTDAVKACQSLGTGWRLPTRIELATTQYRGDPLNPVRTRCIPPVFDQNEYVYAWSSTSTPAGVGNPTDLVYVSAETSCGFVSASKTGKQWVRCVKGDTKPATFIVSKSKDTVLAVDTGLVWERTGIVVQKYAEAKAHCDSLGGRVPIIQELYGIIDTRTTALFDANLFAKPPTVDGGTAKKIVSQTAFALDQDGGIASYEAVSLINSPWADENAAGVENTLRDVLVRCVSTYVP